MVARLTPDQKVACSIHVGFKPPSLRALYNFFRLPLSFQFFLARAVHFFPLASTNILLLVQRLIECPTVQDWLIQYWIYSNTETIKLAAVPGRLNEFCSSKAPAHFYGLPQWSNPKRKGKALHLLHYLSLGCPWVESCLAGWLNLVLSLPVWFIVWSWRMIRWGFLFFRLNEFVWRGEEKSCFLFFRLNEFVWRGERKSAESNNTPVPYKPGFGFVMFVPASR